METLEDVYDSIRAEPAFKYLRAGRQRLVPGEGNRDNPRAFILGEAPGAQEAMSLRPFVGASGKLLRELMACAGLCADNRRVWSDKTDTEGIPTAANVWLTNVVKYRPHRNRNPAKGEMAASRAYILDEWEAVNSPKVIVCVGRIAAITIGREGMERGQPSEGRRRGTWVWHMYHPAYVLREMGHYGKKGEGALLAYQEAIEDHWFSLGEWMRANNY